MANAPYRTLKITYGNYVFGAGQTKRHQTGPWFYRETPDGFEFRTQLQVAGCTGASDFQTEVAAAIAAFSTPGQDLKVELVDPTSVNTVAATPISALASTGAALNVTAEIGQPQIQEGNTERSAVFDVAVLGERPADYDAGHLRYDFAYEVRSSASRRKELTVRGAYTKIAGGTASRATYLAAIAAKVSAIQLALGGDWAAVPGGGETTTTDGRDHVTRFSRTYRQLLHRESLGAIDDPRVSDERLVIQVASPGAAGDASERPLQRIVATFRADVDADQLTGLDDLQTLWEQTLEPWVLRNIRDAAATSSLAVLLSQPDFDPTENVLLGRVEAVAENGSKLLRRTVRTRDAIRWNKVFRAYYPERVTEDDAPTPHQVYHGSKVVLRTVETRTEQIGQEGAPPLGAGGAGGSPLGIFGMGQPLSLRFPGAGVFGIGSKISISFGGGSSGGRGGGGQAYPQANISGGGHIVARDRDVIARTIGIPPNQIHVTETVVVEVFRVVAAPPAGASRASGGGITGGTITRAQARERSR